MTAVSEEPGGFIRIDGVRTDSDQPASYLLSPIAHVAIRHSD
ncbi:MULTISPECIES: hypothetical protein [Mycolicibacter]|nr:MULTISPECIES: hypothetical protein [Mycolicibacter]